MCSRQKFNNTTLNIYHLWFVLFSIIEIIQGGVINREIVDQSHATIAIKSTTETYATIFTPSNLTTVPELKDPISTTLKPQSITEINEKILTNSSATNDYNNFTTIQPNSIGKNLSKYIENDETELNSLKMIRNETNIDHVHSTNGHSANILMATRSYSKIHTTFSPQIVANTIIPLLKPTTSIIHQIPNALNENNNANKLNTITDDFSKMSNETIELSTKTPQNIKTELPHFDIDRYTFSDIETSITTDKSIKPTTETVSGKLNYTTIDYEIRFNDLKLTTPKSFIDYKMNATEISNIGSSSKLDKNTSITYFDDKNVDEIQSNSTNETHITLLSNETSIESNNYDIATNEIRNITKNTHSMEKRGKFINDTDSNLTIPNTAEVWALAGMKNIENMKEKNGKLINITLNNSESDLNSTSSTKLLVDWTEIVKNENLNNNSFKSNANSIENTLENEKHLSKDKIREQLEQENQVISVIIEAPTPSIPLSASTTTKSTIEQKLTTLFLTTLEDVVETTPSIDKNKVDDIDDKDLNKNSNIQKVSIESEITPRVIKTTRPMTESILEMITTTYSELPNKVDIVEATTVTSNEIDETTNSLVETTAANSSETEINNISLKTTSITLKAESPSEIVRTKSTTETIIKTTPETTTILDSLTLTSLNPETTEASEIPSTIQTSTAEQKIVASKLTTEPDSYEFSSGGLNTAETVSESTFDSNGIERIISSTMPISDITSGSSTTSETNEIFDTIHQYNETSTIHTISTKQDQEYSFHTSMEPYFRSENITDDTPISSRNDSALGTESIDSTTQSDTDYNVIIAISVSVVGIIALILLVGFLYVMRKRQKQITYGQRCRPVSLDAYSLDNVSVFNSVRRKGALRASRKSYGNAAFDDPSLKHNVLSVHELAKYVDKKLNIYEEFKDVPQIIARPDEVPQGCEDKNRYANVIPLPETRVILERQNDDEKTEYINANFVRGPKDSPNYYIACQAPLETTVNDFWRMIWEQNSRVIIMATDLNENGIEKCAEYIPQSIALDNHIVFGDFQITLKNREVKEKYAVSTLHIKNMIINTWREVTHFWYQWPDTGVPNDEAGVIAMLLEARSCLKMPPSEQTDGGIDEKKISVLSETNGNIDKNRNQSNKTQGPLTIHCSPGTGRTGTIISCDIALRSLETPKRNVDIPQIVYYVRRGRASAVQTKEQYEFIYKVAHVYATKISGPINDN